MTKEFTTQDLVLFKNVCDQKIRAGNIIECALARLRIFQLYKNSQFMDQCYELGGFDVRFVKEGDELIKYFKMKISALRGDAGSIDTLPIRVNNDNRIIYFVVKAKVNISKNGILNGLVDEKEYSVPIAYTMMDFLRFCANLRPNETDMLYHTQVARFTVKREGTDKKFTVQDLQKTALSVLALNFAPPYVFPIEVEVEIL